MAFENIKMEINMLLEQMHNLPDDPHELHETILEKLNELKAFGQPLPQDLVDLEKKLARDFEGRKGKA